MTLLRRLVILSLLLTAAVPNAWSQSVTLDSGNALTLYGFKFGISSCTFSTNSLATTCAASKLDLTGVAAGRGFIEFEVVNHTATSAALTQALNGNDTRLQFTITVTPTVGYPAGTMANSAALIEAGVRTYGCASGHGTCSATATADINFSNIAITTDPLATTLANQAGTQTVTSPTDTATGDNSFSFVETLTLNSNGASSWYTAGSTLRLNTAALKLHTAPEPASIAVLLFGLGGLAAMRRRRSSARH